jgi:hypothetical protein
MWSRYRLSRHRTRSARLPATGQWGCNVSWINLVLFVS